MIPADPVIPSSASSAVYIELTSPQHTGMPLSAGSSHPTQAQPPAQLSIPVVSLDAYDSENHMLSIVALNTRVEGLKAFRAAMTGALTAVRSSLQATDTSAATAVLSDVRSVVHVMRC